MATREAPTMGKNPSKTEKKNSSPKETWLDWLDRVPPTIALESAQPLLTREELLNFLSEIGVKVSARDLLFWQQAGIIPFPTKRRDSERRAMVAIYPRWMVDLIGMLRTDQEAGIDLATISADLRKLVANSFVTPLDEGVKAHHARQVALREFSRQITAAKSPLARAAKQLETILIEGVGSIQITFNPIKTGDDPQVFRFGFSHRPINDPESSPGDWKLGIVDKSQIENE